MHNEALCRFLGLAHKTRVDEFVSMDTFRIMYYHILYFFQLLSLSHCQGCLICMECLAGHFNIVIQTRNIIHATCPACNKPDAKDAAELSEYFTFLDSWVRGLKDICHGHLRWLLTHRFPVLLSHRIEQRPEHR